MPTPEPHMPPTSAIPVLIAGGGPTGLVLALVLSLNGIGVRIIDRELAHRIGSKGANIQPRAMEMYRFIGVLKGIQEVAREVGQMRKYKPNGYEIDKQWDFVDHSPATPDVPYGDGLVLGQDSLEKILRESLESRFGVCVELGTELAGFEDSGEYVTAHLKKHAEDGTTSDEVVHAQYLMGSDGGRSFVRKTLGLEFIGKTRVDDYNIYGDVELAGLEEGVWHMFGDMTTEAILFRTPDKATPNRWALLATGRDISNREHLGNDHEAFERHLRQVTKRDDIKITRYSYFMGHRPNIRMCSKFGNGGRVFIAGDAAHAHSPAGGQGLNSSVQDAFNLGWKLASVLKGFSSPRLLETFNEERVPVIAEMLQQTTVLLEDKVSAEDASADQEYMWRRPRVLYQLGIHYQWSSIVYDDRVENGRASAPVRPYGGSTIQEVRAGDRAPDSTALEVVKAKGEITGVVALFDIFNPTYHTILLFVKSPWGLDAFFAVARQQPAGLTKTVLVLEKGMPVPQSHILEGAEIAIIDAKGYAFKSYAVMNKVRAAVVRPDGVVGAMVGSADGLAHYFGLIFDAGK